MKIISKKSFMMNMDKGSKISRKKLKSMKYLKENKNNNDIRIFIHLDNGYYKTISIKTYLKLKKLRELIIKRRFCIEDMDEDGEYEWFDTISSKHKITDIDTLFRYMVEDSYFTDMWTIYNDSFGNPHAVFRKVSVKKNKDDKSKKITDKEFGKIFKHEDDDLIINSTII